MTDAVTLVQFRANTQTQAVNMTLAHTTVFLGGNTGGTGAGLPSGGNVDDVLTNLGNGNAGWRKPTLPLSSTNW